MSDTPLLSVVVPFYGVEDYLLECLQSLQAQTLRDIQVVLVDDGSPDDSIEIAEAVAGSGGTTELRDEDLPTAENFPFAPRTLTRAMARRATQLGLQLPTPRLRGMLHLIAFPTTLVLGLLLVAVGQNLTIRLACAVFVLTAGMLFGISAVYHRGTWSPQHARRIARVSPKATSSRPVISTTGKVARWIMPRSRGFGSCRPSCAARRAIARVSVRGANG